VWSDGGAIIEKEIIHDNNESLKDAKRKIAKVSAAKIYKELYSSMLSSDNFKEQVSKAPEIADKIAAFEDIDRSLHSLILTFKQHWSTGKTHPTCTISILTK